MSGHSRLALLLHTDPALAAGGASFSSGLETLAADGLVDGAPGLLALMGDALRLRWNTFDRVFLARAHGLVEASARASVDGPGPLEEHLREALLDVDREVEVSTFGAGARAASRRAGLALLGTWQRLGRQAAADYRRTARAVAGSGHLPVAQGLVWAEEGMCLPDAEAIAAWTLLSAYAASAVRLGVVGHQAAQETLIAAEPGVAELLATPVAPDATPHAFTPLSDIAVERHALADLKLFAS